MRTLLLAALAGCTLTFMQACAAHTSNPDASSTAVPGPESNRRLTEARVRQVLSATTIEVQADGQVYNVRYLGIEIPGDRPTENGRSLSDEALAFNRFLVEGRTVQLEKGAVETDHVNNLLRYVYVDGEMVNKALLTNGYATVATFPPSFQYQTEFLMAEENARTNMRGLWSPSRRAAPPPVSNFSGGTLPQLASDRCDYTGTKEPAIKGNVDPHTGELVYLVPGDLLYTTTVVNEAEGDRWFCTEAEATAAGWIKSKH